MNQNDFQIFTDQPALVYLDSAASTLTPRVVSEAISQHLNSGGGNVHRGLYPLAIKETEKYESARKIIGRFLNAQPEEIVFTRGTTEGINLLAHSIPLQPGDEVIISELEHHSNLIPWQVACRRANATLHLLPLTEEGRIDTHRLVEVISPRTKIISLSLASNVLGTTIEPSALREILDQQGSSATVILDAAQAVGHFPIDAEKLGADAIVFSGHKMYGPHGIGVLWGRRGLLESLPPYQTGGSMIETVSRDSATWNALPWKFEAGTPNIEGAVGLARAVEYLQQNGYPDPSLSEYAYEQLAEFPGVKLLSKPDFQVGIVSFTVEGIHPHDISEELGKLSVCVRAGHHCAAVLHQTLGIPASCRLSTGVYTNREDIDKFISALREVTETYAR